MQRYLLGLLLLLPNLVWATTCTVNGSGTFTVAFQVTGPQRGQTMLLEKVNNIDLVKVWAAANSDGSYPEGYLFQQASLNSGEVYEVRITSVARGNSDTLHYYIRNLTQGDSDWTDGGSVTINKQMSGNHTATDENEATIDNLACYSGIQLPVPDYSLTVTPSNQYALQCESAPVTVRVMQGSSAASGVTMTVSYSSDDLGSGYSAVTDSNGEITINPTLTSALGSYTISAALQADSSQSVSSRLHVVPYKFAAVTQKVIAGQSQPFSIDAQACNDGSVTKVDEYNGSNISYSATLLSPLSGELGSLSLSQPSGDDTPVDFTNGSAALSLIYNESGRIRIDLADPSFDCSGLADCPADGSGQVLGSFEVHARPWSFALCDDADPNLALDGDITDSSSYAYRAAGEAFAMRIYPLVWQSGGATSGGIDVSGYCDAVQDSANITNNFFRADAQSASVQLSHQLAAPADGESGSLAGTLNHDHTDKSLGAYMLSSDLSWSEVGVLRLTADDISGDYLGMDINPGYRAIGRFYPHHLRIVEDSSTLWGYAAGHSGFAYMSQPIIHQFSVQAENAADEVTHNYGRFAADLIATIQYQATANIPTEDDSNGWQGITSSRLLADQLVWTGGDWKEDSGMLQVQLTDFSLVKDPDAVDGPFSAVNAHFGLLSGGFDGVDFQQPDFDTNLDGTLNGKLFTTQPDFRYGRMALGDVGGNQGNSISVPLRTEYWNGSRFVLNPDDSGSAFDTRDYCRQTLWREDSGEATAQFVTTSGSDSDSVSAGAYSSLEAEQSQSVRERVRLWLRQGSDSSAVPALNSAESANSISCSDSGESTPLVGQDWLQYNWRGFGNEDPSAVVLFGVYRGNDRVIYRGESGLTGQ